MVGRDGLKSTMSATRVSDACARESPVFFDCVHVCQRRGHDFTKSKVQVPHRGWGGGAEMTAQIGGEVAHFCDLVCDTHESQWL